MATAQTQTVELSIPLPKSLDTRIYIRLSTLDKVTMLSLTTASQDEPAAAASMGSFVYAMPNVSHYTSSWTQWVTDSPRAAP